MSSSLYFCLLMAVLVAVSISRPTATEDRIRIIARTTISRIKKIKDELWKKNSGQYDHKPEEHCPLWTKKLAHTHFQMSPEIDFGPDIDTPIDSLTSVLVHLRYLQLRLRIPPAQHLQQFQLDLEALLRTLEGLADSQGCPLPNPETPGHKEETAFPVTSNYLHLLELQRYLEKLCLNMDKLKWCKDTDVVETFIF